jgi:aryl-alcohol dehydrogenase-like predicted oxidoreductase
MKKEKILLPKDPSNVKFPWLWIGTWSMGGEGFGSHDERESLRVLESVVEKGLRHFDTAGFYAHGRSEELLRKVISGRREEFFVSTKGGLAWDGRRVEHRASPKELGKQLNESLERLKIDYLDLYQLHWPDPEVPIDESIAALKEMKEKGMIRYWGVGNLSEVQIKDYLGPEENIPHQVHFNPLHRSDDILAAGKDSCVNCIISPLEQGLLGSNVSKIGKNDIRNKNPYFSNTEALVWIKEFDELANKNTISKVTAVLLWIFSQSHVHSVIIGPRKRTQLEEILQLLRVIEDHGLLNAEKSGALLAVKKVKQLVHDEMWECLSNRPMLDRWAESSVMPSRSTLS